MKTKYVWKKYTQKDIDILIKMFNDVEWAERLPYNPFYDYKKSGMTMFLKWFGGIDKSSKDLKDLMDGTFPYEDLPLWVPVKNEYFQIAVRWRFKIGK